MDHFLALTQSGMVTVGIILIPLLVAALLVGLLIGVFQATTQIQEMTLSFLPKLLVLGFLLYLGGPWFLRILVGFATNDFQTFWQPGNLP